MCSNLAAITPHEQQSGTVVVYREAYGYLLGADDDKGCLVPVALTLADITRAFFAFDVSFREMMVRTIGQTYTKSFQVYSVFIPSIQSSTSSYNSVTMASSSSSLPPLDSFDERLSSRSLNHVSLPLTDPRLSRSGERSLR